MLKLVDLPEPRAFSPHEVRLIEGTYALVAQRGVQQMSLRAIARELDVSPGLLVYHFSTHEDLLMATMQWAFDQAVQRMQSHIEALEDPEALLTGLLDVVLSNATTNREHILIYMDFLQFSLRNPRFARTMRLWRDYLDGFYSSVVRAGTEAGVFRVDDVESATRHIRAIVEGHCLQWLQEPDWRNSHQALRAACETHLLAFLQASDRAEQS
ncbi:TetR/AcrR family transcriptional regulator [Streptomyces sp. NPDC048002]|uniref:TetR/AcrR family transcriptional regulator n=1 Tax=Streptomyces sp. NPDC048002 TaxID=3154344 RepID=UPI0033D6AB13